MHGQERKEMVVVIFSNRLIQPTTEMVKAWDLALCITIQFAPCQQSKWLLSSIQVMVLAFNVNVIIAIVGANCGGGCCGWV